MTFEELEKEVNEMKARATADLAFLRCAVFTLSTQQLRGTELTLGKLAEEMAVKLLYRESVSDPENHAFEERKQFWLDALRAEVAARDAAGRL
jgi:hypothetical protein